MNILGNKMTKVSSIVRLVKIYFKGMKRHIPQCITGQIWKTEVAVLYDQVRLVACRYFDIFGWLSVIYISDQITVPYLNTETRKSSYKHREWYVFARRKGLKILFFSTYSLNYVKYVLTIWWNRHRRFQCKENMTVNALIFLTTGAFNIVLHSTSLYA